MPNEDNFDFDRRIKYALSEKGIRPGPSKQSVLKDWFYRRLEKAVAFLQHLVVIVIVVLAFCIFAIGVLKLINILPFLSLPKLEDKIMPLLIILDLCLITITVLVLSKEIYRAFVKFGGGFGEPHPPAFEGGKILGMVVVTTSIVFLTIIISIGQRQEEAGPLGPLEIVDVLYLAASIAIVIISLALFLFVRERKL